MVTPTHKNFHRKRWLSVQQAVDHLSALSEEPLSGADLADLAEEHQLDLYWYRPGQQVAYMGRPEVTTLDTPLRLCGEDHSDWHAIADILRHHPALPAFEQDTPLLEDANGDRLRITFDRRHRPEPFSSRWYPTLAELVVRREDLEQLEPHLFSGQEAAGTHVLETPLLLRVIWQLEQLALDGDHHSTAWLADQLARRSPGVDRADLERVLDAAQREGLRGTPH
ncbi:MULTISPECIES: hypothetical protein [Microbulbifer]|uniref:hypothetical protein n=1 Tax=Microbulbifer TaxID=48073 RepID=UPI001E31F807|nr:MULTISPECIES: hypothetical protein [Microbulbifer]UHQ56713.1 hypothetical protein LVE68_07010 [Microbulbifer sp. YPW16]